MPALVEAAKRAIAGALDSSNAPSVLLLARELSLADLEERCMLFILSELDSVIADATYWEDLPKLTRDTLRTLREATMRNPLLSACHPLGVKQGPGAQPVSSSSLALVARCGHCLSRPAAQLDLVCTNFRVLAPACCACSCSRHRSRR